MSLSKEDKKEGDAQYKCNLIIFKVKLIDKSVFINC